MAIDNEKSPCDQVFGAVPAAIMVDNLKCAVIKRHVGCDPVFNARYLDFAGHYGFKIREDKGDMQEILADRGELERQRGDF